MFTKTKQFILSSLVLISLSSSLLASEKVYINNPEISTSENKIYLHIGFNKWLETDSLNCDITGLYTFEDHISKRAIEGSKNEYYITWKCPYCGRHWPIGVRCQGGDCPSRY